MGLHDGLSVFIENVTLILTGEKKFVCLSDAALAMKYREGRRPTGVTSRLGNVQALYSAIFLKLLNHYTHTHTSFCHADDGGGSTKFVLSRRFLCKHKLLLFSSTSARFFLKKFHCCLTSRYIVIYVHVKLPTVR